VLLGSGDGTFAEPVSSGLAGGPIQLAAGDLDGDLDVDLAVSLNSSSAVGVLIGDGHGSFALRRTLDVGECPHGIAVGDFDRDGDQDVLMTTNNGAAYLFRNDQISGNRSIRFKLVGTKSNRDGIGARVRVSSKSGPTQLITITTAAGYLSGSDKRLVVGLGSQASADVVEIRWPSGIVQKSENVKAGQVLRATEPSS